MYNKSAPLTKRKSGMRQGISFFIAIFSLFFTKAQTQNAFTVDINHTGAPIQPTMWGVFFEDINFAADGGIYAELVKNRSFEFKEPLMGWDIKNERNGNILVINRGASYAPNPRIARISLATDTGSYILSNEGFRGMGIKKENRYNFSILARMNEGVSEKIAIEVINEKGELIGGEMITISGKEWKQYKTSFFSSYKSPKASLNIRFIGKGSIDVDMISLFPQDTWTQRPGGLRADLVKLLADMQPGFIRFPGGCIVEGRDLNNRYQWKKTVGNITQRELIINRWNTEFKHRAAPDYFQSFGLGFYEYFLLAEDIGASPLPILNCGMACQFNSAEVVPVDQLDPYIQDAFDLIEFANGTTETSWGKLRADMGHPAPFNLKMMGVGNEQWGPQYVERYKIFSKAIHNKYPNIKLVSSVGPFSGGEMFNYLNNEMRELNADILDEHYYMPPDFFLKNAKRYDNYDRNGPKIFAGEYAAHIRGKEGTERNTWQAALSEAAFMTGLERNADVVNMCSYAPLFSHVDAWQWAPDLIWFDNLSAYGTPNYYVQKLFSINKGTHVVSLLQNNEPVTGQDSLYASAVIDKNKNELVIKIVNASSAEKRPLIELAGIKNVGGEINTSELKASSLDARNSIEYPATVLPVEKVMNIKGEKFTAVLAPYSLQVIRIKI